MWQIIVDLVHPILTNVEMQEHVLKVLGKVKTRRKKTNLDNYRCQSQRFVRGDNE